MALAEFLGGLRRLFDEKAALGPHKGDRWLQSLLHTLRSKDPSYNPTHASAMKSFYQEDAAAEVIQASIRAELERRVAAGELSEAEAASAAVVQAAVQGEVARKVAAGEMKAMEGRCGPLLDSG